MSGSDERREQLVAAAVTGGLTVEESRELDALCASDPAVAAEVESLRATADRFAALPGWDASAPDPATEHRIVATTSRLGLPPPASRGRRRLRLAVAAAALVAAGAGGTLGVQELGEAPSQATPTGPPGTLGAYEAVSFDGDAGSGADADADIDADLVAHTWGTEAVLAVDGLPAGETFDVVFVDASGKEIGAGAFLGSEVTISCRVNAAVMREEVVSLRIQRSDGSVVRSADLPTIQG